MPLCFTDVKKKGEKQEINLQLAAFAGMFELIHTLLLWAKPAFKTEK